MEARDAPDPAVDIGLACCDMVLSSAHGRTPGAVAGRETSEVSWEETEKWRISLHQEFDQAVQRTSLPERPDYERANALLIKARRAALLEELP